MSSSCTLILFSRTPIPGKTKRRLLPILSPEECALLQEAMALDLAEKLSSLGCPIMLCYSDEWQSLENGEEVRDAFIEKVRGVCTQAASFTAIPQTGEGLGQRMANAMDAAFETGAESCLLMGSDLPDIMRHDIEVAMRALTYSDVVLGPTADGGYWLIGSTVPLQHVFEDKQYGTAKVLTEAVAACRAEGKKVALSRETFDVDVPEDYFLLCKQVNKGDFRLGKRTVEAVSKLMAVSATPPEDETSGEHV